MSGAGGHDHEDDDHPPHGGGHGGGHDEGGHGEPWLVSYADLMTLLFGFFVLMYTFEAAKHTPEKDDTSMVRIRRELATYFGGQYINPLEQVERKIMEKMAADPELLKQIVVQKTQEGLKIIITSQMLFESGSATMTQKSSEVMIGLVGMVKDAAGTAKIRVEGHTDDAPISTSRFPTNWELSASRAVSVVRLFENAGFRSDLLTAVGYGSSRPVAANFDASGNPLNENRAKNRRVVLYIVNNLDEPGA